MKGRTLTRADLCEAVHEEVGLTRQDCAGLVERTLDLVAEALENGAAVKLSGFGVFQLRWIVYRRIDRCVLEKSEPSSNGNQRYGKWNLRIEWDCD